MDNQDTFLKKILEIFSKKELDPKSYSSLALAYIGDGVYDLIIRTVIVEQGNNKVNLMHKQTSAVVKAETQARQMRLLEKYLTEEELKVYKRGRNAKSPTSAKNASIVDYRIATGFEALLGYLYLDNQTDRLLELVKLGWDLMEEEKN